MKSIIFGVLTVLSLLILSINIKLHSENFTYLKKQNDIVLQLNFLESELKANHLGQKMQQIFPEGYVFINALYGLAWCELAINDTTNNIQLRNRAVNEALYAYNQIDSDVAKYTFDRDLYPKYGIFYLGWRNYLLSKILETDTSFPGHQLCIEAFETNCKVIKTALDSTTTPYLQSYFNQSWPADMFMAMASLSNYNKLFDSEFNEGISIWLEKVKKRPDPKTKMVPHKVNSATGKSILGARGCSMALILRVLPEIDTAFANEQYKLFKTNFVTKTFGLPSVREYPKGKHGLGDIDSGPVIFGVGFSATIAMIGTFSVNGDIYI